MKCPGWQLFIVEIIQLTLLLVQETYQLLSIELKKNKAIPIAFFVVVKENVGVRTLHIVTSKSSLCCSLSLNTHDPILVQYFMLNL